MLINLYQQKIKRKYQRKWSVDSIMMDVDLELDLKGMRCPLPLLKAKQAMSQLDSGQTLKIQATDPGSVRDFASYARIAGHELVVSDEVNSTFIFILKRK